jgi:hypothetical protein
LLVGLPDVVGLGVDACAGDAPLVCRWNVRRTGSRIVRAAGWVKQRRVVRLTDLPAFRRPAVLAWHKLRRTCPNSVCAGVADHQ